MPSNKARRQIRPKTSPSSPEGHALDLTQLDVPERVFSASTAGYSLKPPFLEFVFAQELPDQPSFLAGLVIQIPIERCTEVLHRVDPEGRGTYAERLEKFIRENQVPLPRLNEFDYSRLPSHRVAFEYATLINMAYSSHEAEFLFYKISSWRAHQFSKGKKIDIVFPVVRVQTSSALMSSLLTDLIGVLPRESSEAPPVEVSQAGLPEEG